MLNLIRLEFGTEFTQLKGFFGDKSSSHTYEIPVVNIKKSERMCIYVGSCPIYS